ncbi:MAG TPA: hybrid sensor histidine kinase/response regulator, partial [Pseudomonas sp.]|nr:hybrid sensor histidine kinase/response regulator [Pseudomonas sp.]
MPRLYLALLLLWLACPALALTPAPLDSDLRLSLGAYSGYYEDVDGTLDVEQVLALDDDDFRKVSGEHANLGKNASVWWFKIRLVNALQHDVGGYLEVNYPLLDHLQVHLVTPDGKQQQQESGDTF